MSEELKRIEAVLDEKVRPSLRKCAFLTHSPKTAQPLDSMRRSR